MKTNIEKKKKWLKTKLTTPAVRVTPDIVEGNALILGESYTENCCVVLSEATDVYNGVMYLDNLQQVDKNWWGRVSNLGTSAFAVTKSANFPSNQNLYEEVETSVNGDVFIKFYKCYRKLDTSFGLIRNYEIANYKKDDDFVVCDCFLDEEGNELPYVLIAKYPISLQTGDCANSRPIFLPTKMYLDFARTLCRNKGAGYQLIDLAIYSFWRDLGLIAIGSLQPDNPPHAFYQREELLGVQFSTINQNTLKEFLLDGIFSRAKNEMTAGKGNGAFAYSNKPSQYRSVDDFTSNDIVDLFAYGREVKGYNRVDDAYVYTSRALSSNSDNVINSLKVSKKYPCVSLPNIIEPHSAVSNFYLHSNAIWRGSVDGEYEQLNLMFAFGRGFYGLDFYKTMGGYGYLCYRPNN